jgi:hypothetical protein
LTNIIAYATIPGCKLTIVHLAIVLFNLFGWIPKLTRKAHFISILLTAASWFLLGIFYGMNYCPFTDWQWQVKEKLGEGNLPVNFIEYFAEKIIGRDFNSQFINNVIAISFAIVAMLSVYINFMLPRLRKTKSFNRVVFL